MTTSLHRSLPAGVSLTSSADPHLTGPAYSQSCGPLLARTLPAPVHVTAAVSQQSVSSLAAVTSHWQSLDWHCWAMGISLMNLF